MTRKDYILIAAAVAHARSKAAASTTPKSSVYAVEYTAKCLAANLAADNPRFDRERFLKACGAEN